MYYVLLGIHIQVYSTFPPWTMVSVDSSVFGTDCSHPSVTPRPGGFLGGSVRGTTRDFVFGSRTTASHRKKTACADPRRNALLAKTTISSANWKKNDGFAKTPAGDPGFFEGKNPSSSATPTMILPARSDSLPGSPRPTACFWRRQSFRAKR